jgi:alpha-mannosidase
VGCATLKRAEDANGLILRLYSPGESRCACASPGRSKG